MAVEVASLKAVLDLEKKNFDTGLKSVKDSLGGFGKSLGGVVGGVAAAGAAFGAAALAISGTIETISRWTAAARESVAIEKQLNAVIKSTGGVAGVTAEAAKDLAESLQAVTNFDDDAVLSGENLLLTFTKIGKDVFPRATETMLDMSQALGQDLKSSAIQLGKALNDPLKGMTALQRVGVTFTAEQKNLVKSFIEAGDIAAAQGVILDELATEFGGSARALADPAIQLQNAWGNLEETLGMALLPTLNTLAQAALPALNAAITALGTALTPLGELFAAALGPHLKDISITVTALADSTTTFANGVNELGKAFGFSGEEASALSQALSPLNILVQIAAGPYKGLTAILDFLGQAFSKIAVAVNGVRSIFGGTSTVVSGLSNVSRTLADDWQFLVGIVTQIQTGIAGLITWVNNLIASWGRLISQMTQQITIPDWITPGSPTPLEMGIRGITSAIKSMPDLGASFGGGMIPMAAGGGTSNTTNINLGGQSFSFSGSNGNDQAILAMITYLRSLLEAR